MSIEKEINQRVFNSEYQKATVNIIFTCNWIQEKMKQFFEPNDITLQQFNILRILRGSKLPLSTMEIRERMMDKMSDTSRLVDRLTNKGLAKKQINENDKRLVDVTITKQGQELLLKLDAEQTRLDNIVAGLSKEEAALLNTLLDKIRTCC